MTPHYRIRGTTVSRCSKIKLIALQKTFYSKAIMGAIKQRTNGTSWFHMKKTVCAYMVSFVCVCFIKAVDALLLLVYMFFPERAIERSEQSKKNHRGS